MAIKIQMPKMSDTMEEGRIIKWLKKEGDRVQPGEVIAEIETDKANMDMEAYDEGILLKIVAKEGTRVPLGGLIAILGSEGEDISSLLGGTNSEKEGGSVSSSSMKDETKSMIATVNKSIDNRIKSSPLARKIAKEKGIDLNQIHGSGPSGRIIKRDVDLAASGQKSPESHKIKSQEGFTDVPLTMMRETIARRLTRSNVEAPHFYLTVEVKMDDAIAFREALNSFDENLKISFNDIIVKACATALKIHPEVNAAFLGDKIRLFSDVHIGIAVAIEEGLITPVIRDVDKKSLRQVSIEAKDLALRARERKLNPDEYNGSTFTVSNLGMFDVEEFTAIINPPEAAILAVGSIIEKPVVEGGTIKIGNRMRMTLSSDHRVVDGAVAARFMQTLRRILENPAVLSL
jgi:pyruvate dehydrogenase E2 component (dihydrolipoamide acetyltransferase)